MSKTTDLKQIAAEVINHLQIKNNPRHKDILFIFKWPKFCCKNVLDMSTASSNRTALTSHPEIQDRSLGVHRRPGAERAIAEPGELLY